MRSEHRKINLEKYCGYSFFFLFCKIGFCDIMLVPKIAVCVRLVTIRSTFEFNFLLEKSLSNAAGDCSLCIECYI